MNTERPDLSQEPVSRAPTQPADANFDQRVAALAKRERELTNREKALNGAMTVDQIKAKLAQDKVGFLKQFGIELPQVEEEPPHIREFREFKERTEARERAQEEQAAREALKKRIWEDENLSLVRAFNLEDEVYNSVAKLRSSSEGDVDELSIANSLESFLLDRVNSLKDSPKLKHWFTPASEPSKPREPHALDTSRTVTEQHRPASSPSVESTSILPTNESIRRIAEKYQQQMKG